MSESLGITDEDRERMAAFADRDKPHAAELLGEGDNPKRGAHNITCGAKTIAVAEHLRDELAVGDTMVAKSRLIAREFDRSTSSIARSLEFLSESDVTGLVVSHAGFDKTVTWRVERTPDGDE